MRLLLVEDELALLEITAKRFRAQGYSVDECANGAEALDLIRMTEYDAVVLDGLTVLETLRREGNATPVLLLTARDSVADRVRGLDCGADDYLVKPFAFDELSARVRALMRRPTGAERVNNALSCGDLTVDVAARTAKRGGQELSLTKKEFAILEYLLRNRGVVLTRDQIERHVWDYDFDGGSNVIDVYIRCLRKKVDADRAVKLIHTGRCVGYVLRSEP